MSGRYPDLNTLLEGKDRAKLLVIKRSWLSILSSVFLFLKALLIVYIIELIFYDVNWTKYLPFLEHFSLRWLAIVPLLFFLEILRRYHNDVYIFGLQRLTRISGRLGLSYKVPTVNYAHIRSVKVDQDIYGRIFNYGNLAISTAAQEDVELWIEGVRDPEGLSTLIEEIRNFTRDAKTKDPDLAGELIAGELEGE